ncbi:MAG: periplasmic heavy metal sensor [Proteobacteria bacterium]|nr:periplasmic heavy metal sensor [Pseudomonadota bacterium]
MIRHSVVAIALLCASGMALAQTPPAPPPHPWHGGRAMMHRMEQRRMEQLTVLLDLTPAQQQKVRTILAAEHARMRRTMEQAMRQIRETHRAVRKDTVEKLTGVLSPEQMKKFEVLMPGPHMMMGPMMMHGMMMHGRLMHGGRMGPPPPPGAAPGPGPR